MKTTDEEIMCALIGQVSLATKVAETMKKAASERDVLTYITRPMWQGFCRGCKLPENSEPSEWNGLHTIRVYGSETRIVESSEMWSISLPII